ncbi:TAP-like protein-domain-containing protein [Xylariaceae sp. FL0016]|nr:TAP-like protein-domain-containing protein [Xylariaceae sp. FL0016]
MTFRHSIIQLGLAAATLATPVKHTFARRNETQSGAIQWGKCDFESTSAECANFDVPLDYVNQASTEKLTLQLAKVAAASQPSKGSILFNFGGPGYTARESLDSLAEYLLIQTGGQYDLVAFDPRGTGNTIPFECFDSPEARLLALAQNPFPPADAYDSAIKQTWASSLALTEVCRLANLNATGVYGTSYVARDLMQVVDALGEDGMLRFWGFSYGSLLGEVVAAMFPERMDRIVLDGVVNGHNYFHRQGIDVDQLLAADDGFRTVLEQCIQAGDKCALSTLNSTAIDLEATLRVMAEEIRDNPITIGTEILDYSKVKNMLLLLIKYTSGLPTAFQQLSNLLHREKLSEVMDFYNAQYGSVAQTNEALYAVQCGDKIAEAVDFEDIEPDLEYFLQTSRLFAASTSSIVTQCARWPIKANEQYGGDFNVKTANPVLFIGNTYDPVTPATSAYNMSATYEGSRVVEQVGFGHASLSQVSACTGSIIAAYFTNGTLPAESVKCAVDVGLFD